jgi:hypothetical protein
MAWYLVKQRDNFTFNFNKLHGTCNVDSCSADCKNFPAFMEPKCSLSCSEKSDTALCSEPVESSQHPYILFY